MTTALFSFDTRAATEECVDAPSCTDLGYTRTADECPDGSVKCPWNTGLVFCECSKSYKYTCNGDNETAGTDKCGNYYAACGCDTGYHWADGNAWPIALHAQSAGFITVTAPVRRRPLIQPAKRFWVLWYMSTITVSADKSWHRGRLIRMVIKPAATQRP